MYDCYLPPARGWQGTFDEAQGVKRNGGSAAEIKSVCELSKAKIRNPCYLGMYLISYYFKHVYHNYLKLHNINFKNCSR
jgi:hypothetical protein